MIRVTVELIPGGIENHPRRKILGTLKIANDGTGSSVLGNYDVAQISKPLADKDGLKKPGKVVKKARVEKHYRSNVSVWKLIAQALANLGHEV